jgi:hypothetical protein
MANNQLEKLNSEYDPFSEYDCQATEKMLLVSLVLNIQAAFYLVETLAESIR